MAVEIPVSEVRADLGPITSRVEYGGEIVYLTKHGRRAAALVPAAAAELLEQLEDMLDTEDVTAALGRLKAGAEERVPYVRRSARGTA